MNAWKNPQAGMEMDDFAEPCPQYQRDPGCEHVFDLPSQICRRLQEKGFEYAFVWLMALVRNQGVSQVGRQIAFEVVDDADAWILGNDGEAKSKTFYHAISWRLRPSKIGASNVVHEVVDQDDAPVLEAPSVLLLDIQNVVNEDDLLLDLGLCPAVDNVDVSGADPLRLASDSSLMGSFETSPCNAGRHLQRCGR
ncbi:hypothetical protein AYO21_03155 [Fonsecaea monophora]|uniref:Uncharacterized protein n=1 Tax=Fonsecaea monophora TaxID=254056 RepID=A0A177FG35_9EURO|nr:hypothetical protein AYO21_03155 [Fonsecaea monophora]OAG42570.1 hypothetical protein AYO21_03155 [Fonsecaea monophora]